MIVIDPDEDFRQRLAADIAANGSAVLGMRSLDAFRHDPPSSPTVVVVGPNVDAHDAMVAFTEVGRKVGGLGGVLFVPELDATILREALRMGLADVLTLDATREEVADALARARADLPGHRPGESQPEEPRATVLTVFSTKGGCGKSLVASNLAALLAKDRDRRVALVDLDLQSGDLAIMLQMMPALSLYDASHKVDRMDMEALGGYLTAHESGVQLLAAPMEPSVAEAVTADAVAKILDLLRTWFDYIVIDSPAFFTDQVLAALDVTDQVILVGSMDVPSVKNLRLALNTLNQLGIGRDRIRTVLNRADSNVGLRRAEVEKSLDTRIDVQIPSSRDVPLSINQGVPLALSKPRSPVVSAISQLLANVTAEVESTTSRRLFGRRR